MRRLQEVANFHGSTPAQVALAWLLAQGPDIIPIPITKLTARMDENAASALLQLNDEEVQAIRNRVGQIEIKGTSTMQRKSGFTPPCQSSCRLCAVLTG